MLQDISLHVLDIAQNSIKAGADLILVNIDIQTDKKRMKLEITDNGCGMSSEQLAQAADPFYTSRTTRKVGLGVPFLKQSAECTGGTFSIASKEGQGTRVMAEYHLDHIDCLPLGDITSTFYSLVIMNADLNFIFHYGVDGCVFQFDTAQIRELLGNVSLANNEVAVFVKTYLKENIMETDNGNVF